MTFEPSRTITNTPTAYNFQGSRTRNTKPYLQVTAYERKTASAQYGGYDDTKDFIASDVLNFNGPKGDEAYAAQQQAYNQAYDRFVAKLGDKSSFGATLTAERRETYGMISGLIQRIFRATLAARRGNVVGVLAELRMKHRIVTKRTAYRSKKRRKTFYVVNEYIRLPRGVECIKAPASAWLLWSYGISPLLSDINNATDVFIRDVPGDVRVTAAGKASWTLNRKQDWGSSGTFWWDKGSVRAGIVSHVSVHNSDLWLANQLGLVNPVQFANEAIPFSFVVDWFSNWSSVINSLTDMAGLSLKRSSVSFKHEVNAVYRNFGNDGRGKYEETHTKDGVWFRRSPGLPPPPKLQFRLERFEWRRALNAISLLIGFLPNKSSK